MRVLLTGGAGYVGSHLAVLLLERGHEVILLDDLSSGHLAAVAAVAELTGREPVFVRCDLSDAEGARAALAAYEFDAVVHCAGLKSVAESVAEPLRYYRVNIDATLVLMQLMRERGVTRLVFSSSATVYGRPQAPLVVESHPTGLGVSNPYGRTKSMIEQIIRDVAFAWPELSALMLRYFNPVGAHTSGRLGESPRGIPNNLMPYVAQVAAGARESLSVYGTDYPTPDGTGVRDYIHVMDLAEGHLAALAAAQPGALAVNLGTGVGTSVFEAVEVFSRVSGRPIPYRVAPRRPGDLAEVIADPSFARQLLGWSATRSFEDACVDAWRWQEQHPVGFAD